MSGIEYIFPLFSDFLKKQLDDHLVENYNGKVKVVHAKKREGLIRTRLLGAKHATGEVLIFLDSHVEANINWLPPLLGKYSPNMRDHLLEVHLHVTSMLRFL